MHLELDAVEADLVEEALYRLLLEEEHHPERAKLVSLTARLRLRRPCPVPDEPGPDSPLRPAAVGPIERPSLSERLEGLAPLRAVT